MNTSDNIKQLKRIDVEMADRGIARSRSEASDLISRKKVFLNGKLVLKQSQKVSSNDSIRVDSPLRYVSRAGEKLEHALGTLQLDISGYNAIDIGSSTGGFTEALLKRGANRIVAVDVGTDQLAHELKSDSRVVLHESTDIRQFSTSEQFDLAVIDVSFISLTLVLPKAYALLRPGGLAIALVKPQFEMDRVTAKKFKGVVTDENLRKSALERIKNSSLELGFKLLGESLSPISGEKGNQEYFLLLKK